MDGRTSKSGCTLSSEICSQQQSCPTLSFNQPLLVSRQEYISRPNAGPSPETCSEPCSQINIYCRPRNRYSFSSMPEISWCLINTSARWSVVILDSRRCEHIVSSLPNALGHPDSWLLLLYGQESEICHTLSDSLFSSRPSSLLAECHRRASTLCN